MFDTALSNPTSANFPQSGKVRLLIMVLHFSQYDKLRSTFSKQSCMRINLHKITEHTSPFERKVFEKYVYAHVAIIMLMIIKSIISSVIF